MTIVRCHGPLALLVLLLPCLAAPLSCGGAPAPTPNGAAEAPPGDEPAAHADGPAPSGDPEAAEQAVLQSMSLEQQGQLDAAAQAASDALAAGGGRRAQLQAAKIAILRERYDEAEPLLRAMVTADPQDADAQYNLGLVAHRRGRYNDARSGYLAALRARPDFPDARYNLAILTWNRNVKDEARHHVERFVAEWPQDPRGPELTAMVGGTPPGVAPAPPPSESATP